MSNFLYYWKRFIEDTSNERVRITKLNQNAPRMKEIGVGDVILAIANDRADYVFVARFTVDEVGENEIGDPDRDEYGKFFFRSNRPEYYDAFSRRSVERVLRNSDLNIKAKNFGYSFQGHNGVRRLSRETADCLLKVNQF